MGHCCSKNISVKDDTALEANATNPISEQTTASTSTNGVVNVSSKNTPHRTFSTSPCPSPFNDGSSPLPPGILPSPARTPRRMLQWPFPPPSPAKPIMSLIMRRQEKKVKEGMIPEHSEAERPLDKSFGYGKNFTSKYELGKEVGRGHFGHTCWAKVKRGELKGQTVAAKIISKAKMTTAISIEDVRREVKLLKALAGHDNLIKFCDVCEDGNNVYLIMELCEGGELLNRILSKGGRYLESDAKGIIVQILRVVAFCHLQGVVHRDLKPENFLFSTRDEDAPLKLIDFGLSDFIRPDQRLNDIVGSAYYVAPEVLHRSYSIEADMWSIGVITYILLCGSRPFWAKTESGIFRSVLRADPNFNDSPWPNVSSEATDFVKRLLNKDNRKRLTASQALYHPWLRNKNCPVPLDILVYKLVKAYLHATPLKRAALKALSKALPEDELGYHRAQFTLLEPKHGLVSLENFRVALMRNATDAMKESRVLDILKAMAPLSYQKMDFEEFCSAATSVHQVEAFEEWETIASKAFQFFEIEGNIVITIEKLAQDMNVGPAAFSLLNGCIRSSDKKLSFAGYVKYLHGVSTRSSNTRHR